VIDAVVAAGIMITKAYVSFLSHHCFGLRTACLLLANPSVPPERSLTVLLVQCSLLANEPVQWASAGQPLHVGAVRNQTSEAFPLLEIVFLESCKAPLGGHVNFLTTRKFEFGSSKCFHRRRALLFFRSDGHEHLADAATRHSSVAFTPCPAHASLKAICSRARKHFVDTNNMERVWPHPDVEKVLPRSLNHALVRSDACCFKSLARDLLFFVTYHVDRRRELIAWNLLLADLINTDLRVWHSAAKAGFRKSFVFTVAIAFVRTTTHLGAKFWRAH